MLRKIPLLVHKTLIIVHFNVQRCSLTLIISDNEKITSYSHILKTLLNQVFSLSRVGTYILVIP